MSSKKFIEKTSVLGLVIIAGIIVAIVIAVILGSLKSIETKEVFITAFGGAAFAYLFVKYGEWFTRLSQREKLNVDTITQLEYLFNKHLNQIGTDLDVADQMIDALKNNKAVHFLEFKDIQVSDIRLQDLKNVDFVNDVFGYFSDIEKLNADMKMLQKFSEKLIDDSLKVKGRVSVTDYIAFQTVFNANAQQLIKQLESIKDFLNAADKKVEELIGKIGYVRKHRSWWLSPAGKAFSTTHYDKEKLKEELPGYIATFKKGQEEVIRESETEIKKVKNVKKTK